MIVAFDLTIYEADGETPILGETYEGELEESSFQTPEPTLPHPRPYLSLPLNGIGTSANFLEGSTEIGTVQLRVLDKRTDPDDQTTGLLTAILPDIGKRRAVLRRWVDGAWQIRLDGVLFSARVDPDSLVHYIVELHDARDFERNQKLFRSNFVLYGQDGAQGPADDYGTRPFRQPDLSATPPFESIVAGGISHFERLSEATPANGIHFGLVAGPSDQGNLINPFNLVELGWPVYGADRLLYYRQFRVRWRPKGYDDEWIELRNMPRADLDPAGMLPGTGVRLEDGSFFFTESTALYLGSTDPDAIPDTGEEIELQVIAEDITERTPFWWDNGTLGDLLQEIADGLHTDVAPRERYDAAALAAFAADSPPARFILREPVTDRRRWMEEHIYKADLRAPVFGTDGEIVPRKWEIPDTAATIPLLLNVQPVGEWTLAPNDVISEVEVRYIREHLEPRKTITTIDKAPWYYFGFGEDKPVTSPDPTDTRRDWQRLIETEVVVTNQNPDVPSGGRRLVYNLTLLRSTGNVDGSPIGGDTQSEHGQQSADRIFAAVLFHHSGARPRIILEVVATPENLARTVGDFVRLRAEWLPDPITRTRGTRQVVRIKSITELEDPSLLRFELEYTGVADNTADDDETGTGTGGEDCLTGGVKIPGADGLVVRAFSTPGRFEIENTCDHAVTLQGVVVIAGGGGGGDTGTGGGGGAGGLMIEEDVVLGAGMTVTVDVGAGGVPGANGADSVFWLDRITGLPLDPDTDDPDDGYHVIGGGQGGGNGANGDEGGSGGGGGAFRPSSGGATSDGGLGTPPQGSSGGGGDSGGGLATSQRSAGGGGGSFAGAGTAGDTNFIGPGSSSIAGEGGPSSEITGWPGFTAGGGGGGGVDDVAIPADDPDDSSLVQIGTPGSGYGAGGGGAANAVGATSGRPGIVAFRYSGGQANLQPPTISSVEVDNDNRVEICIDGGDWAPSTPDDYAVRIEYAVAAVEPDPSSGDWQFAGMLEAPGCILTAPIPTGAKVWARGRAQADGYKFSGYSAAVDADAPETPGFLSVQLFIDPVTGTATLTWTPNAYSAAQKIRGIIHAEGASTTRPLALLDGTVVAGDSPYTLPGVVAQGEFYTIDIEAWEDGTYAVQGRIERRSEENPVRRFVEVTDGLEALSDVDLTDVQPGDLLQADDYGIFRNVTPQQVIQAFALEESGDADEVLNGLGQFVPVGAGDGWLEIVAATDQDVTNNTAMQNDAELFIPGVVAGEVYDVTVYLMYAGQTNAVDLQAGFNFGASGYGWYYVKAAESTGAGFFDQGARLSAVALWNIALGTLAGTAKGMAKIEMQIRIGTNGTIYFQHANNNAIGEWSRRCAGSVLRYRKLTP